MITGHDGCRNVTKNADTLADSAYLVVEPSGVAPLRSVVQMQ